MRPRILFLVPAEYDALRNKGVDRMIQERDEGGYFERVVTVHPLAPKRRVIEINGAHRIYELGIGRGWASPLKGIAAFATVVRIARRERVDLVRATDAYFMGLLAWWVSRVLHIPFCVSVHADYQKRFALSPRRGFGRLLRQVAAVIPPFVLPRAHMVMPIREHLVPSVIRAGADAARVRVIPHGIDMTPFREPLSADARATFGLPADRTVVSFTGRLTADNYTADMTRAIARVASRRDDVIFVIAGEGSETPIVEAMVHDLERTERVRLLPFQSYDRIVALRRLSAASLCLMAGFSLIEACAAGSPPIAYDVEWHRELVQNGVSGWLVREGDVDGVVAAIDRVLDDPTAAAAMGAKAREVAFDRHDLVRTSAIKRDGYATLLASRHMRS